MTENEVSECLYYGYEIRNDIDRSVYVIEGVNNKMFTLVDTSSYKTVDWNHKYIEGHFSRVSCRDVG